MPANEITIASIVGLLLLALLLFLARRSILRRISRLSSDLARIAYEGRYDERLPAGDGSTLGSLGSNLNRLLSLLAEKDKKVHEHSDGVESKNLAFATELSIIDESQRKGKAYVDTT